MPVQSRPSWERDEVQAFAGLIALFTITAAWWLLALWPVANGPAWLERTRYVCFGVDASGLPDAGGWIGLVGGPLGMLTILAFGWQRGMRGLLQRSYASPSLAVTLRLMLFGCVLLIGGAVLRLHEVRASTILPTNTDAEPGDVPRLDRPAPRLGLVTQYGDTLAVAQLAGRPLLVTFAFAHCETVCPLVVTDALRAQEMLQRRGDSIAVVVVTLDPWRDTPSRLPQMAAGWGIPQTGAWVLSGAIADVERVLDAWEVPRTRDARTGEVTHPTLTYVVDEAGRIAFAANGRADALVSLIERL